MLATVPLQAATYCVGPAATGSGSGADWNNLKAWSSAIARGDTWYIANGAYTARTFNTAASGTTTISILKATVAAHGPATGWSDGYAAQAVITGTMVFSTPYWLFSGVSRNENNWFDGSAYGIQIAEPAGVYDRLVYWRASNSTMSYVYLAANQLPNSTPTVGHYQIDWTGGSLVTAGNVSHCYVHGGNNHYFMRNCSACIVEYCASSDAVSTANNHGENINWYGAFGPSDGCIARYNKFYNNFLGGGGGGTAVIAIVTSANCEIYGNVFYNNRCSDGLVGWSGTRSGYGVINLKFHDNTVAGHASSSADGINLETSSTGCIAENNIWYLNQAGFQTCSHDYNAYFSTLSTPSEAHVQVKSGSPFVNYSGLDFMLATNTTAGINLGSPYNVDLLGNTRTTWSRGAYEFAGSGAAPVITSALNGTATNGIAYSYQITASGSPTAFGASPLPTGLSVNGGTGGINGTPAVGSPPTTNSITITATNGFGFDSQTLTLVVNAQAATIGVLATNVLFMIYTNGTIDSVFVVTNTAGAGTLNGTVSTAPPFSIVGNATYALTTGHSTNITVRYSPTVVANDSGTLTFTGGGGATVSVTGFGGPVFAVGSTIPATNGLVFAPFTTNAAASLTQTSDALTPNDGGRAIYWFNLSATTNITISATVTATNVSQNSFWVSVDNEPTDPTMIWDVVDLATNFPTRVVSWRGTGTESAPQFATNSWAPLVGYHKVIIRGREANAQLKTLTVNLPPVNTPPTAPPGPGVVKSNAAIFLSWSTPSSDGGAAIGGFNIYRGTSSGNETLLTSVGVVTNYTDIAVVNGTTYYYKVAATNAVGEGDLSTEVSGVPSTVPTAPLNLIVNPGFGILNLQWSAPSDNGGSPITGYYIYRGPSSGNEVSYDGLVFSPSYSDTNVINGTIEYYKVSAFNDNGEGALSGEASGTPVTILVSSRVSGPVRVSGSVRIR